jgi:hypothetical protein
MYREVEQVNLMIMDGVDHVPHNQIAMFGDDLDAIRLPKVVQELGKSPRVRGRVVLDRSELREVSQFHLA